MYKLSLKINSKSVNSFGVFTEEFGQLSWAQRSELWVTQPQRCGSCRGSAERRSRFFAKSQGSLRAQSLAGTAPRNVLRDKNGHFVPFSTRGFTTCEPLYLNVTSLSWVLKTIALTKEPA